MVKKNSRATQPLLSIGQLGHRCGVSVSALRFYEQKGLIQSTRNAGGQRRYHRSQLRRLSFVLIAQQLGFSLAAIKTQLDTLPESRAPTQSDWKRMSLRFKVDIDKRIDDLTQLRDKLSGCIGCGCLSLKACHLYNPDDNAKALGSGPRFLLGDNADDVPVDGRSFE
ncbi:MAG: redox-sensitive transcriptional activator SoxR [Gammaproteobacteria bacterium]|nr:redox-sensitive transcriptional activator SoxR [Gammaproteobacteria bacterium]